MRREREIENARLTWEEEEEEGDIRKNRFNFLLFHFSKNICMLDLAKMFHLFENILFASLGECLFPRKNSKKS